MDASVDPFADFPDVARMWVIPTDRTLSSAEQDEVTRHLETFFRSWQSHGREVIAGSAILHGRFIVVGAYVPGDDVSGCGIDASVHELDDVAGRVGFSRAPVLDVFFESDGDVQQADRARFGELARQGSVTRETAVFDTSLASAADWKTGAFKRLVSDSWHADVFF